MQKKCEEMAKGIEHYDTPLGQSPGGGPNGAAWNPSTDICIAVHIPKGLSAEDLILKVNGDAHDATTYQIGQFRWLVIDYKFWEKAMLSIKPEDYRKLYYPRYYRNDSLLTQKLIAPQNIGEVLWIELQLGDRVIKTFFHATYPTC